MANFGWSYPPGCTGTPYDDVPGEPWEYQPRCTTCRAFLPTTPDRVEKREHRYMETTEYNEFTGDYKEQEVVESYPVKIWDKCKRCGGRTEVSEY
jgi:hypothetical protein